MVKRKKKTIQIVFSKLHSNLHQSDSVCGLTAASDYHRQAGTDRTLHWLNRRWNSKHTTRHWLVITNMLWAARAHYVCKCLCARVCACVPKATRPVATITVTDVKELGRLHKRSAPGTTRPARVLNQFRKCAHAHTHTHDKEHAQGCSWRTFVETKGQGGGG